MAHVVVAVAACAAVAAARAAVRAAAAVADPAAAAGNRANILHGEAVRLDEFRGSICFDSQRAAAAAGHGSASSDRKRCVFEVVRHERSE